MYHVDSLDGHERSHRTRTAQDANAKNDPLRVIRIQDTR